MLPLISVYTCDQTNVFGISSDEARALWNHLGYGLGRSLGTYPEARTRAEVAGVRSNFQVWFERGGCTPALLWICAQKEARLADLRGWGMYTATDALVAWSDRVCALGDDSALVQLPALRMDPTRVSFFTQSLWDRVESFNATRQAAARAP